MSWWLPFKEFSLWVQITFVFVVVNLVAHIVLISISVFLGFFDLKKMLAGITSSEVDESDDGRVE